MNWIYVCLNVYGCDTCVQCTMYNVQCTRQVGMG